MEPDKIRNCSIEYTTGEQFFFGNDVDELDEEVDELCPTKAARHTLENFHGNLIKELLAITEALLLRA